MTCPISSRPITLIADDYGMAPGVSDAIRSLLTEGRLSGTSCMTVGEFWADAAGPLRSTAEQLGPRVEIGLHLCLTAPFRPLTAELRQAAGWDRFPGLGALLRQGLAGRVPPAALAAEITAQYAAFVDAFGREPDFIDGHQHVHLFPGVSAPLAATLDGMGARPRWIRRCGDGIGRILRRPFAPKALVLQALSARSDRTFARLPARRNRGFSGIYDFGDADYAGLFDRWLATAPADAVMMCHPGFVDAPLAALDPVTTAREAEYQYFSGPAISQALARHGRRLAPFGEAAAGHGTPIPAEIS